jgi:hypothetical protein
MSSNTTRHQATSGSSNTTPPGRTPAPRATTATSTNFRAPSALVHTRRSFTLWQAGGATAVAAALTVAVTAVIPNRAARGAVRPHTPPVEVSANQGHYGSADAAEQWLTATRPQQSTTYYGSADAAEHWLTKPSSPSTPG